jgi:hypothetical protein
VNQNRSQKSIQIRRVVGEFLLIVAGVSVALGAEALWEARLDRIREAEYLDQVRSDLAENERRLLEAIDSEEMTHVSIQTAIDAVVQRRTISPDSAQAWLHDRKGLGYSDPRPLTGTFSALISTGDLRLVRDPSIREGLITYLPQLQYDHAEFDRWVQLFIPHIETLRAIGIEVSDQGLAPTNPTKFALARASTNPAVLVALHGVLQKHRNRRIYLDRMLDATRELSDRLAVPN